MHACIHTCIHTYMPSCMHKDKQTCSCMYICIYIHLFIYLFTHIHTYSHTRTTILQVYARVCGVYVWMYACTCRHAPANQTLITHQIPTISRHMQVHAYNKTVHAGAYIYTCLPACLPAYPDRQSQTDRQTDRQIHIPVKERNYTGHM